MAAMMLEAAAGDIELKDASFHIVGAYRSPPLTAVAQSPHRPMFLPPQFEVGCEASGAFAAEPSNFLTAVTSAEWRSIRRPASSLPVAASEPRRAQHGC
jgi:hypothetical protein